MSELQCVARLKIHDGKLDEFKHLAAKCAELVRTKDTGTLQYELYFNSDNTECLVFERYRDSQALLDHHKNLGDTMAAILQTCSGSGEICGTPSPELIEQLKDFARSGLHTISGKLALCYRANGKQVFARIRRLRADLQRLGRRGRGRRCLPALLSAQR